MNSTRPEMPYMKERGRINLTRWLFLTPGASSGSRARASDRAGVNAGGATEGLALTPARSGAASGGATLYVKLGVPIKKGVD